MKPIPSLLKSLPLSSSLELIPGSQYILELERYLLDNLFRWALFHPDSQSIHSPRRNLKRLESAAQELQTLLGDSNFKGLSSDEVVTAVKQKIIAIENELKEERKRRTIAENRQEQLESLEEEFSTKSKQTKSLESRVLLSKQQQENLSIVHRKVEVLKILKDTIAKFAESESFDKTDVHDMRHSNGKPQDEDSV